MQTEKSSGAPVNDALNKPKNKLGIDWRIALGCLTLAIAVALFVHILLGLILLFVLPAIARLITRKDEQIYRLWSLSFLQKAHYDPGKVRSR
jgi:type IV secretory pathway VirB3-like protein